MGTRKREAAPAAIVADICLYGGTHGAGYLARTVGGVMFGDGQPRERWSMTEAVWLACEELRRAGVSGAVHVFEPTGQRMATTTIERPAAFGDLQWTPAPVYVINAADLEAEAERQARERGEC